MKLARFGGRRGSAVGLALVLITVSAGLSASRPQAVDSGQGEPSPLESLDGTFREIYAQARAATLARLDPVIINEFDLVILIHRGERHEAAALPPLYHRLKSVAHAPLAAYVALAPYGDEPVGEERRERIAALRDQTATALAGIEKAGFRPDHLERQKIILGRTVAFLDRVLEKRGCDRRELIAYTRMMGPLVLANGADAVRAQIDTTHAVVRSWKRRMTADEWSRVRVIVRGGQMPRRQNAAVQYFTKLLGLPGECRRLVYAESLSSGEGDEPALKLLATHELDSGIGSAFFDDPERMEIDLLGHAAASYLDSLDLDAP